MPEHLQNQVVSSFLLYLDDELVCRAGAVPLRISSLSGSGFAVLALDFREDQLDLAGLRSRGDDGGSLQLRAQIGGRTISLPAQLVWCEVKGQGEGDQIELIVDMTAAADWSAIVAAHEGRL